MKPDPLDEYPIHQSPLSMARVATSDRNFYDRYYFNAHDKSGELFLVTGFGVYPNLGVVDAFATVRRGDEQRAVRFSDAMDTRYGCDSVGNYRVEVIRPLESVRLVCDHPDLFLDLTWQGSFPAILEEQHLLMTGPRPTLDATRFAQVGTWSGTMTVDGTHFRLDSSRWVGTRDRSWGIRPSGDPDPAGRIADEPPSTGFWWTYVPLRFEDYAMVLIAQEDADGHRTLNHATRVYPDGRVEQLGWPRFQIAYDSGTRRARSVRVHMADPRGNPLVVDIEPKTFVTLQVGGGYGSDDEWSHGRWMGRDWSLSSRYDVTDPALKQRIAHGVLDYVARATCDGAEGWGMFEHGIAGRHEPSGFTDPRQMAP